MYTNVCYCARSFVCALPITLNKRSKTASLARSRILFLVAQAGTAFSYLLYKNRACSAFGCSWGPSAAYSIICLGLYIVSGILADCIPRPPLEFRPPQKHTPRKQKIPSTTPQTNPSRKRSLRDEESTDGKLTIDSDIDAISIESAV
jgi:hypothetical protein